MFWGPPRPSSGACTAPGDSGWSVVGRGLAGSRPRPTTLQPEAPGTMHAPDDGRGGPQNMLSHT